MRISTMMRSLDDNVGIIAALSAALGASMFCDDVLSQPQHLFPEKLVYLHRCLQVATSPKPATQSLPLRAGMGVDDCIPASLGAVVVDRVLLHGLWLSLLVNSEFSSDPVGVESMKARQGPQTGRNHLETRLLEVLWR